MSRRNCLKSSGMSAFAWKPPLFMVLRSGWHIGLGISDPLLSRVKLHKSDAVLSVLGSMLYLI